MLKRLIILGAGASLLAGCFGTGMSQAPIATTYPISEQQKMQAAHHWDVLAQHQAEQLMASSALAGVPLYIDNEDASSFHKSFKSLLTSALVTSGAKVYTSATGANSVTYKVDVIEHKDRDSVRAPVGSLTALAAGVAVATVPFSHNWSDPAWMLVPAAAYGDVFSGSWTSETNFEVVITTQVTTGSQIAYSSSNIYYVNGGDREHYSGARKAKQVGVSDRW